MATRGYDSDQWAELGYAAWLLQKSVRRTTAGLWRYAGFAAAKWLVTG